MDANVSVIPPAVNFLSITPVGREPATCGKCGSSKPAGGTCPGCGDQG